MTGDHGSPGTAGDRYRCDPEPHRYRPAPLEPGCPSRCADCEETRGHANHRALNVPTGAAS